MRCCIDHLGLGLGVPHCEHTGRCDYRLTRRIVHFLRFSEHHCLSEAPSLTVLLDLLKILNHGVLNWLGLEILFAAA